MSAARWEISSNREGRELVALPAAATGLALLLSRPWLVVNGAGPVTLGLVMAALLAVSLAAEPFGPKVRPAALPASAVVAIGIGAVAVARAVSGPVPPLPAAFEALALNVVAAVAEEAFFRRFLYGRLLAYGAPAAVVLSALVFALVHVALYGGAVFWVDLGAGLLFGWQRWASGGWTAPAAAHVAANLLVVLR